VDACIEENLPLDLQDEEMHSFFLSPYTIFPQVLFGILS